jgi:Domain of unknown function (DUF5666)
MTPRSKLPSPSLMLRRRQALAAPLAALLTGTLGSSLLTACGGGGGDDAGATGAQSFTTGPISGLGSIIVGGVRFEDNSARVEDDDGGSFARSALKLGMMVEVLSSSIDDSAGRGVAALIRFGSEIKGPVASVDATAQTFRMLDQTVVVRPETVFDATLPGGFAAIAVGQILEVHALFDSATGQYVATRIELEDSTSNYRLRGVLSQLDTTARTFRIGDAVINYAGVPAGDLPTLTDGMRIRVRLQTTQVNGQWVALTVRSGVRRVDDLPDARLRGYVTAFTSATQFEVNGIPVDASGARMDPPTATVALGTLVEVRGSASSGTIVATRVKVIDRLSDEWRRVELHGSVSELDTTAQTFLLRDVRVNYSRVVEWRDGVLADLANGREVEVKGLWSDDRSVLMAAVIEFE